MGLCRVWFDRKRGCYCTDLAFVLAKATSTPGEKTISFEKYLDPTKAALVEFLKEATTRWAIKNKINKADQFESGRTT